MGTPIAIRASSLPLVTTCGASIDCEIPVDDAGPEARLGTAVHKWLAQNLRHEAWAPEDAGNGNPDFPMLCHLGVRCWQAVKGYFPGALTEQFLEWSDGDIHLTGHADVLSVVESPTDGCGQVRVLDYKTGRTDEDHDAQLRGYAWLALQAHPWADDASVCLVRVREQTADWGHYSRREMAIWWEEEVREVVVRERREFNPGRHCGHCKRGPTCPAKTALMGQMVDSLLDYDPTNLNEGREISPETLARMLDRVKLVEKACESARGLIRAAVDAAGGSLLTGDGRRLVIEEQERKVIEPEPAWPILQEALGDRLAKVLTVGKTKLEDEIKALAPRGQKGQAVKELMDRLESARAIRTQTTQCLEVKRHVSPDHAIADAAAAR